MTQLSRRKTARLGPLTLLLVFPCLAVSCKSTTYGGKPKDYEIDLDELREQTFYDIKAELVARDGLSESFTAAARNYLDGDPNERLRALEEIAAVLADSNLKSEISCLTDVPGATIKYKLIALDTVLTAKQRTNRISEEVPIGLYNIWSERNSEATSSRRKVYRIIKPEVELDIEETR